MLYLPAEMSLLYPKPLPPSSLPMVAFPNHHNSVVLWSEKTQVYVFPPPTETPVSRLFASMFRFKVDHASRVRYLLTGLTVRRNFQTLNALHAHLTNGVHIAAFTAVVNRRVIDAKSTSQPRERLRPSTVEPIPRGSGVAPRLCVFFFPLFLR